MSDAQEQVLRECHARLGEHFEGHILAVVHDHIEGNDAIQEGKVVYWGGGWIKSIGLAEYTKHMLLERTVRKRDIE